MLFGNGAARFGAVRGSGGGVSGSGAIAAGVSDRAEQFGNTLKAQRKFDEAFDSFREALRYQPDYATAHNNLGVALLERGDVAGAADCFASVVRLAPNNEAALLSLSSLQLRLGRIAECEQFAERVLALNPASAEAHKNRALAWLLQGDYERGWPEYEWHWQCPGQRPPPVPAPRWDGSSLAGRTILLHQDRKSVV